MPNITKLPVRIVILDNHALFRAGLRLLIESRPGMEVVGEAGNVNEGFNLISSLKPDVVLLELNLAGQTGVDIIPCLIKASDRSRFILVTCDDDPQTHKCAVQTGVTGVVLKTQSAETLIKAIEKVNAGEVWLERSMVADVLFNLSRNHAPGKNDLSEKGIPSLSEREKQVVMLIGQGYKNKKIAEQLCISETTVRHHLTSIYNKVGVSDRLELLVYAHRYGLVRNSNH
jgi:DNA-binding NarL/FixJ family response regulator